MTRHDIVRACPNHARLRQNIDFQHARWTSLAVLSARTLVPARDACHHPLRWAVPWNQLELPKCTSRIPAPRARNEFRGPKTVHFSELEKRSTPAAGKGPPRMTLNKLRKAAGIVENVEKLGSEICALQASCSKSLLIPAADDSFVGLCWAL